MDRRELYGRYAGRLWAYFASFVLVSAWTAYAAYAVSESVAYHYRLTARAEDRLKAVENVFRNNEKYRRLSESDQALKTVVEKALDGVTAYRDWKLEFWDLDLSRFPKKSFPAYSDESAFHYRSFETSEGTFEIVLELPDDRSSEKVTKGVLAFVTFTLAFAFPLFLFWRRLAFDNLKPVEEAVASIEDFTGNVNHEIKNPLAEIVSTLALAKRTKSGYDEAIEQCLVSTGKITGILDSLQQLAHIADAPYMKRRMSLTEAVERVTEAVRKSAEGKGICLEMKVFGKPHSFLANPAHVEIVLWNLAKNAVRYTPKGGSITIVCDGAEARVQDTGAGISKANLGKVFERRFRESYAEEDGTGLWLPLVRKICEINGWDIRLESEKGRWTVATVIFR